LRQRYGKRAGSDPELIRRLDYELGVLEKTGFVSYLLIVGTSFILQRREAFLSAGAPFGCRVRSSPTFLELQISIVTVRIDFRAVFESGRVSPPDIDIDFCEARRGEVLEYVRQKYGETPCRADHYFWQAQSEKRRARRGASDGFGVIAMPIASRR